MGIWLDMIKKIQNGKQFKQDYELNRKCEDKNCIHGKINIFKSKEPNIYTISIDCSEIFPSKEKLYEYYLTIYKSFDSHFKQVMKVKDIMNHKCTRKGMSVTLSTSNDYYGINEVLKFTGTMADCRDWFCDTLANIYRICFN